MASALNSLNIRPARTNDAEALRTIRREAILVLATEKLSEDRAREWANSAVPGHFRRAIDAHYVYVAEIAEEAVGWVEFDVNQIDGLYVRPNHAGQGVGSALLAYAEEQIGASNHPSVVVYASWNAEHFYIHRGYEPLSERSPETGRLMIKRIESDLIQYEA